MCPSLVLRILEAFLLKTRQATVTSKVRLPLAVAHLGRNNQGTRPLGHQLGQDTASLPVLTAARNLLDRTRMWSTRDLQYLETQFFHLPLREAQVPLPEEATRLPARLQADQPDRPGITRMEALRRPLPSPILLDPHTIVMVLLLRLPILTGTIPEALITVHPRLPVDHTRLLVPLL